MESLFERLERDAILGGAISDADVQREAFRLLCKHIESQETKHAAEVDILTRQLSALRNEIRTEAQAPGRPLPRAR